METTKSDKKVTQAYMDMSLHIGINFLKELVNKGEMLKYMQF